MSKKVEAIKKMVFYAEQNPEELANLLAGTVSDVATEVKISGDIVLTAPTTGTKTSTYVATVYSQYGDVMGDASITYALKSAVTGVSINSSTGVVTLTTSVTDTSFIVTATSGGKTAEKTVTVLVPTTVVVDGDTSITIPASDSVTETYTAIVKDQNGDAITNPTVTYALKSEVTGVSVSGNVVTVASTASAGSFILVATCNSASAEYTVTLAEA